MERICDSVRRGDIAAVRESLESFWENKKENPWHRIYTDIEKYWKKEHPDADLSETLLLLRDGVFASLDMQSLSLPVDVGTPELLEMVLAEDTWKAGRRTARNHCASLLGDRIRRGHLNHMEDTALELDGFGYLLDELREARLEQYRKAEPDVKRKYAYLKPLLRSREGRRLLRSLSITEERLEKDSQRFEELMQAYEHALVDMEVDFTSSQVFPDSTRQVTLNGKAVENDSEQEHVRLRTKGKSKGEQERLTEFLDESESAKGGTEGS
ncbi:hypothetical protein EU546_02745 [Candidatus Thorarchaeota archaeon]|nr:MAG: hypothetical protein EU546_02745 [Candidatus Thorarchaeota archaeon]